MLSIFIVRNNNKEVLNLKVHVREDIYTESPIYIVIDNLTEASESCIKYIKENRIRASEWIHEGYGKVIDNNKVVAMVSYNGRVWEVGANGEQTGKEIQVNAKKWFTEQHN